MITMSAGQGDPELQRLLSDALDRLNRAAVTSDDETPLSIRATDESGTPDRRPHRLHLGWLRRDLVPLARR
ncbi:hypothetical protein [Actinoplanes palleronii]|uniref:Uncharacterized protein n=1 Tax=Actinoplanes palleronii TaxID=113570 RepID=A0ABQ4B914_9ACTN|nr:hypothetical protein [Actinoplanes palleronii]GIE67128.1 hypothetical protein Apa02nite_032360 [Actinoplanes palleronii]